MPATTREVLLAPNEQIEFDDPHLRYPLLGSIKYDGTRVVTLDGAFYSRNMKPFRNDQLAERFKEILTLSKNHGLVFDAEIYDHSLPNHGAHTSILSAASKAIPPSMRMHVFDVLTLDEWEGNAAEMVYSHRYLKYRGLGLPALGEHYEAVEHVTIQDADDAKAAFEVCVEDGYEGLMLRCPHSRYKFGRATKREGIIFKFKQWETMDGKIIEVVQRRKLKEGIERTEKPTGGLERVHTKDSYELDEMVGAFKIRFDDGTISEVNYGRGFPHEVRRKHWEDRESLIGKHVEVRHLPHGAKDGVRIGTLVRFREDKDS